MEDTGAMEGGVVTSGVMLEGADVDLPAVLSTGWACDTGLVGPCAWVPTVDVGLAVELVGVGSEELSVLEELFALAAAVWLLVVSVLTVAAVL